MSVYALSTALLSGLSLQESIACIQQAGFDQVELSGADWDLWLETPEELARALDPLAGIRLADL